MVRGFTKIRHKMLLAMVVLVVVSLTLQSQMTHERALQVVNAQSRALTSRTLSLGAQRISDSIREAGRIFQSAYLNEAFRDHLSALVREPATVSSSVRVASLQSVLLSLVSSRTSVFSIIYVDSRGNVTYCTRDEAGHYPSVERSPLPEDYRALLAAADWTRGVRLLPTQRHMAMKNRNNSELPYVYTIARKIVNTEAQYRPAGVMYITVTLDDLYTLAQSMEPADGMRTYLLDQVQRVVFDSTGQLQGGTLPWEPPVDGVESIELDHIRYLPTQTAVEGTPWRLLSLIPEAASEAAASEVSNTILKVAAIALLLAVLLATLLSRAVTLPLERLTQAMVGTGLSTLGARVPVVGRDETAQLSKAYNTLLGNMEDAIDREYRLKLEKRNAQLSLLQAQLNPHFLDNVLQSISSIALIRGVPEINTMAKSLGRLLHASIKAKGNTATLAQEMDYVQSYLDIQSIRFGDRISVRVVVPPELMDTVLPRMTLQPMVENAITHGLENRQEKGSLLVCCSEEGSALIVEVTDNGQGIPPQQLLLLRERIEKADQSAEGIGLPNLYARLKLLYGDRATLTIESEWSVGTCVRVSLPLERRVQP